MIEIEREEKSKKGRWAWQLRRRPEIRGLSREPLLDACRALKAMGEGTEWEIGLFRPGRSDWDLRTTVGHGADLTVAESQSARFAKFRKFAGWATEEA